MAKLGSDEWNAERFGLSVDEYKTAKQMEEKVDSALLEDLSWQIGVAIIKASRYYQQKEFDTSKYLDEVLSTMLSELCDKDLRHEREHRASSLLGNLIDKEMEQCERL